MKAPPRQWLVLYQYIAGLCDMCTGVLLIAAPVFTLGLMGVHVVPQPIAFVRYIGVFVLGVGMTYLWAVMFWPLTSHAHIGWSVQWKISALFRSLVALFVLWQVASGGLESRWLSVAATDGAFALVQWWGLMQGWLERVA